MLERVQRQESCAPVRGLALWCRYIQREYAASSPRAPRLACEELLQEQRKHCTHVF